jgi:hypothetical protein
MTEIDDEANANDESRRVRGTLRRAPGRTQEKNGAGGSGRRGCRSGGIQSRNYVGILSWRSSSEGRGRGFGPHHNPWIVGVPRVHLPPYGEPPEDKRSRLQAERDFRWSMVQLLRASRKRRDENKPARLIPERPSMWELYEWFKARGELAYFYAYVCPRSWLKFDPRGIGSGP